MKNILARKISDVLKNDASGALKHGTILTMTHEDLDLSVSYVDFINKTTHTAFIKPSGEVKAEKHFKKIVEKALEII